MLRRRILMVFGPLAWGLVASRCPAAEGARTSFTDEATAFFGLTNLHEVHLVIAADQWDAMEPKRRGDGGFPGFPGAGPGGPGAAGGPGGPEGGPRPGGPGGPGGFDLSAAFEQGKATRPGLASAMGLEFEYVKAAITIDGARMPEVGIRYKGNGTYMMSQGTDKRPFKIDFRRYDKKGGFKGMSLLNFHNNIVDRTYLHEALGYEVSRDMGVPGSRTAFARVFITIPSKFEETYLGVYTLVEQVDENFLQNWFGTRKGVLMKPGGRDSLTYRGDEWAKYEKPLNVQSPGTAADHARVVGFLKSLGQASDEEFAKQVGEYLDLDSIARFLALNVGLVNLDSILTLGQNYYAYLEPQTGRWHWWLWDLDNCWGYFGMMGSTDDRVNFSIRRPWQGQNRFVERLLKVDEVQRRYQAELRRLIEGPMNPARLRGRIDAAMATLRTAFPASDGAAWAGVEEAVYGARGGSAAKPASPGGAFPGPFGMQNLALVDFVQRRVQSVADQLAGKTTGAEVQFGGPMGGARGPGGPGGPRGGRPGGPNFLAMGFLMEGDTDHNGELSREEFLRLGETWWGRWDAKKAGSVDQAGLATAINESTRPMGGMGGPGAEPQRLRPAPAGGGMMFSGPGQFLAPVYLKAGDADGDNRLSAAEAKAMFERWAKEWDGDHNGALTAEEIGSGFGKWMPMPGGFPGGRPGPGPGGPPPGGPGSR